MRLKRWLRGQPKGALTALMKATDLSWATVSRAARGDRVSEQTAKTISEFTGGVVSVEALRHVPKKRGRAA
jgi:hypothetical protein